MVSSDLQFLEELSKNKYFCLPYLKCRYPDKSESGIYKSLKRLIEGGYINYQEGVWDHVTGRFAKAYYLTRKGAKALKEYSPYIAIDDVEITIKNSIKASHNLSIPWINLFVSLHSEALLGNCIEQYSFEGRQKVIWRILNQQFSIKIQDKKLLPDAILQIQVCDAKKNSKEIFYFIECDNNTITNHSEIKDKLKTYEKIIGKGKGYLLFIVLPHDLARLVKIFANCEKYLKHKKHFYIRGCTLLEIKELYFWSGIWGSVYKRYRKGTDIIRGQLPL